jgi:hypothetical protein
MLRGVVSLRFTEFNHVSACIAQKLGAALLMCVVGADANADHAWNKKYNQNQVLPKLLSIFCLFSRVLGGSAWRTE